MSMFSGSSDIWVLRPTAEDLLAGAKYAAITLPWTFNRMMMNTGSRGQQSRGMNITKGILAQEMLYRKLKDDGIPIEVQRKSHRSEDLFDFRLPIFGESARLDVKSINYFSDYADVGREPFSSELIADNAGYAGQDWRQFFPMLVPHTQIAQDKQAYCFGIASSIDFRANPYANRDQYALTAFPYGPLMAFTSSKRLCLAREEADKGFSIACTFIRESMLDPDYIDLTVLGEWAGELRTPQVRLTPDTSVKLGPFSCLSSFQIEPVAHQQLYGSIQVTLDTNDFTQVVRNAAMRNINLPPEDGTIFFKASDFCNLILPNDYEIYFIGWTMKEEFLQNCRSYAGWVWPSDRVNRYHNQPWNQITDSDEAAITRAGFSDSIQDKFTQVQAGWLKTTGRGGGACCYVFPNIGYNGGVKEHNLYVLPKDLRSMGSLL